MSFTPPIVALSLLITGVSGPVAFLAAPAKSIAPAKATVVAAPAYGTNADSLVLPKVGAHQLHILSPTLLELTLVTTKQPEGRVDQWDWVDDQNQLRLPDASAFKVLCNGKSISVA